MKCEQRCLWGRKQPSVVAAPAIWLGSIWKAPVQSLLCHSRVYWYVQDVSEELTSQIPALGLVLTPSGFLLLMEVKGIGARAAM